MAMSQTGTGTNKVKEWGGPIVALISLLFTLLIALLTWSSHSGSAQTTLANHETRITNVEGNYQVIDRRLSHIEGLLEGWAGKPRR